MEYVRKRNFLQKARWKPQKSQKPQNPQKPQRKSIRPLDSFDQIIFYDIHIHKPIAVEGDSFRPLVCLDGG